MNQPIKLSRRKQIVFFVVVVAGFFALLEGILALAGIRPVVESEDPYVGFAGMPLFVEERQPDGSVQRVTAPNKRTLFNPQHFPQPKPAGTFRIFAVGGSTTYGHPYDDRTSFCAWMRELLHAAEPGRTWEVLNAGGVSYASYRDAALLEEFARYEPDLFVVYGSQNEFLERRTYGGLIDANPALNRLGALASRTRIYTAMRSARMRGQTKQLEAARTRYEMSGEVDALLDAVGGTQAYARDDTLASQIAAHYEFNLRRMKRIADAAGARIIFAGAGSNYKDCSPFKSQHRAGLDAAAIARCETLIAAGVRARVAGDLETALGSLRTAAELDPRDARVHYELGRVQLGLGREAEARASFERAVDEDVCPLRQTSALRAATRRVAENVGARYVDFEQLVADSTLARTGQRIAGEEVFLDHVHPTVEANGWLAAAIVETMIDDGMVHPGPAWPADAAVAARHAIAARWDVRLQALGLRNVARVFTWAGKTEEAGRLVRQAQVLDPQNNDATVILGSQAAAEGRSADAIRHYEQALAADPGFVEARNNLAVELSRAGRYEEALAHYAKLLEGGGERWAVHANAGHACMQLGRFADAAAHYAEVIKLRPSEAEGHLRLGQAWMRAGRPVDGERAIREAVRLAPRNAEMSTALGTVLAQQNKRDEAAVVFKEAIAAAPDHAPAHLYLGSLLWQQGDLVAAKASLEKALQLDPDVPEGHNALGLVLWKQGDLDTAQRAFEAELRLNPDHSEARDNRAFILASQGKVAEALIEYREAVRRRPRDPKTLNGLAWLLATHPNAKYRDGDEALRLAQRADSLAQHRHPLLLNTLAAALAEKGRFADATRTAEEAVKLARSAGQEALARDIDRMAARYRAGEPMRTGAKLPSGPG